MKPAAQTQLIAVFLLLIAVLLFNQRNEFVPSSWSSLHQRPKSPKEAFIKRTLESDINGPYEGLHLQNLCKETKWTEGLIFSCTRVNGGFGNVRNVIQNCVRFAIEAGAALVVPEIEARKISDISSLEGNGDVTFDTFFDRPHFMSTLQRDCPQMQLIDDQDNLWDRPTTGEPLGLRADDLDRTEWFILRDPALWRSEFDKWLKEQIIERPHLKGPSKDRPILVSLEFPLLVWPADHDGPTTQSHFSHMLRNSLDIRILAAKVLYALSNQFHLRLQSSGITPNAFLGAHLRTESDSAQAGWRGYDEQAGFYLEQAEAQNLSLIYLATGNHDDMERFKTEAWRDYDIVVTSKTDLLEGEELKELKALRFDQQGLVDFEVLLRASSFAGPEQSSFSWTIALRRHVSSTRRDWLAERSDDSLEDEFSTLYGWATRSWRPFVRGLWP
ncbi:MAG: hypothetical protein M1818_007455 [Claussenomyces sp. TS43310]|nr:MAG: hypothetical protein M1818_007455 [Claussenomyces sp. TS43310]